MKTVQKKTIIDILGWYGIGAIILAYALSNFQLISTQSALYNLLNFTGAVGVIVEAHSKRDYPEVVLNIIWALIAIGSVLFFLLK